MSKAVLKRLLKQVNVLEGQFCFYCGADAIEEQHRDGEDVFYCQQCQKTAERAYIFDGKAVTHVSEEELVHETVGAVIQQRQTNNILLFLRRKYPFQYTLPAGHLEIGQTPLSEIEREVEEEAGMLNLTWENITGEQTVELVDPCRRGADKHRWHVFKTQTTQQPRLSDEGRIIGWYTPEEVHQLHDANLLTPPTAYWLQKIGVC